MDTFIINSLETIQDTAFAFLQKYKSNKVFAFYGDMGVGKTTFIKALCAELKISDVVNSPSFSIVNEYKSGTGESVYHFDFYRLNHLSEAYDMGCEDYFDSGYCCLIEWPDKIDELLPLGRLDVYLEELPNGTRKVEVINK